MSGQLLANTPGDQLVTLEQLRQIPTPNGTTTHRPIPHAEVIDKLIESLDFRRIAVSESKFAVSNDGNKMFGFVNLAVELENGACFSIGIRNAHDKTMRLSMTIGLYVFICTNMTLQGDFSPVLLKHSKNANLIESLAIGVDSIQRNFEPMRNQVMGWRETPLDDQAAKLTIYRAFVEGELEASTHLLRQVHHHYFEPEYQEFEPRNLWSLQNAFTCAFRELQPLPRFRATAELGNFFQRLTGPVIDVSSVA